MSATTNPAVWPCLSCRDARALIELLVEGFGFELSYMREDPDTGRNRSNRAGYLNVLVRSWRQAASRASLINTPATGKRRTPPWLHLLLRNFGRRRAALGNTDLALIP
jgi:hypothetical protein